MNSKNHLKRELNVSGDDIWQQKTTNGIPRNRFQPRNIINPEKYLQIVAQKAGKEWGLYRCHSTI